MRRLLLLIALAFLPSVVAHADGCPPITCAAVSSVIPGSSLLALRPQGQQGSLVAYDVVHARRRFSLGPGQLSADGGSYFSLRRGTLARFDARTGRLVHAWPAPGKRLLGAVSSDGRAVALYWQQGPSSTFWLVDGRRGGLVRTLALHGMYEPEALSPSGRRLYLVHWRANGYDLRTYDFAARRLTVTKLDNPQEKMSGTAWSAIATRDGRWLLTLYLKPTNTAFVHALDLSTGIAHCIDLPVAGSDFLSLGNAALALSPGEQTLYLANSAMGTLYAVDLVKLRIARTVSFPVHPEDLSVGTAPNAVVSANGRVLAFSAGRSVWRYDTAYGVVRGPRFAAAVTQAMPTVAGLAFTPDGRQIVALRTDNRFLRFDAATGARR